ncbi:MAG: HEAT repeat domain-containing protein [Desulfobulbaceae bacterium]|nr:HEAT repeat domain-containing protein [Desulfobulbaceae bacterium]
MGSRALKNHIFELLISQDLEAVLGEIAQYHATELANILFSAICRNEELLRWRAISAMGVTLARVAVDDMEKGRIFMRRLLWSLNDESGGIGWGAPEVLAEAMVHHRGLAEEYIHMLISYMRKDGDELHQDGNYLEHELLQRGLLWGICRLASQRGAMLIDRGVQGDLLPYLCASDNEVRGIAALGCGLLRVSGAKAQLEKLIGDDEPIRFYVDGVVSVFTVENFAVQALAMVGEENSKV